ncbi:MAG: hypothetical protein QM776_14080 [Rhodocyclaceae bacterium]
MKQFTLSASTIIALATSPVFAATPVPVTESQLSRLHTGDSRNAILQALGEPKRVNSWINGTSALVYEVQVPEIGRQTAYIGIDRSGKMQSIEILDE